MSGSFSIEGAQLDGLTASFDFPGWGLVLNDIRGRGQLHVGPIEPRLQFEVRDVDARAGGMLRILRGAAMTPVPFDRVAIQRIGTSGERAADLLLEVAAARTGRSALSGRALFGGLFALRRQRVRPRMEIRADWHQAGDALTAVALGRGARDLEVVGENARVQVEVASSFQDLDGRFRASDLEVIQGEYRFLDLQLDLLARGPPYMARLERLSFRSPAGGEVLASGSFDAGKRARLRVQTRGLETGAWLPPSLRPLLGGRAAGWLAARADLATRAAVLEGLDVTLDRDRRGPLPGRLRLHTGPLARRPDGPETLVASLQGVRWRDGRLSIDSLRALAFGGRVDASASLGLRPDPSLALAIRVRQVDLRQALPGSGLGGLLSFDAEASGPLDALRARLQFPPGARLDVFDQAYVLPQGLSAEVRGDVLRLPRFTLAAPGAGQMAVQGELVFDRRLDLQLVIHNHRLDRLPFVARSLPSLSGQLAGNLRIHGHPQRLVADGELKLERVVLGDDPLGDGRIQLRGEAPDRTRLQGVLFQGLTLTGQVLARGPASIVDLDVTATRLRLDRFLPDTPALGRTGLVVGGLLSLRMRPRAPLRLSADFQSIDFTWGCTGAAPRPVTCTHLRNQMPVRLRAEAGGGPIELQPTRLEAPDSQVLMSGRLQRGILDARLEGTLGARLLEPLLRKSPIVVAGKVAAKLRAQGPVAAPRFLGSITVQEPLAVRGRKLPLEARVRSGTVLLEGDRVRSDGLDLEAPGVRLRLAGSIPFGTADDKNRPLDVRLTGEVQAIALVRALPAQVLSGQGQMQVDLQLAGTIAQPRFGGQAQVGPMDLKLRYRDTRVLVRSGRLQASGRRIQLDRLVADLSPGGQVVLGPAGRPAEVEVLHLVPLTFGQVQLPARGERLQLELPFLSLTDGRFDVQLAGDGDRGPLVLSGEAHLLAGELRPTRQPRAGGASRIARKLPPQVRSAVLPVALDVRVKSNGDRFVIDPGWLPDLHMDLDLQLTGSSDRPKLSWQADAKGIYSTIALFLYRLLS